MPCNYRHNQDTQIRDDCIADLKAQQEYLGPETFIAKLVNDEVLEQDKYNEESIRR